MDSDRNIEALRAQVRAWLGHNVPAGWRAAIRPETKLLFGETLGNPGLDVLDIPAVAAIATSKPSLRRLSSTSLRRFSSSSTSRIF